MFSVPLHELTDVAPRSQHLLPVVFRELALLAQHFLLASRPQHAAGARCSLRTTHIPYTPDTIVQSSVACCGV